jgi:alpha-glucosidase (family GH31 glycosyl hydrolase)
VALAAKAALGAVAIAAVIAVVFAAEHRSRSHEATSFDWTASKHPFALSFKAHGKLLTSETPSGDAVGRRLGYVTRDGRSHAVTDVVSSSDVPHGTRYVVATDEPNRHAIVTVTRRTNGRGLDVRYTLTPDRGVASVSESFAVSPTQHFLGGGESGDFVDLRNQIAQQRTSYTCGSEFPMPYFVSSAGYGIFARALSVGQFAFPGTEGLRTCGGVTPQCPLAPATDRIELCFKQTTLRYEVYAGTPAAVMRAFTADAGRAPPAPPEQFGAQKWRGVWAENRESFLRADAATYRRLGIPLTWMHINDPWEVDRCWGTHIFDPKRFPDPGQLVRDLKAQGLHTMIWISPLVREAAECPATAFRHLLGTAPAPMIDLTDRAQAATFERQLERVFALGIDGIKGDRGDEFDLERAKLVHGVGTTVQNRYSVIYAKTVIAALRKETKGRFSTIFRAGAVGSQTLLPGIDVGDEPGTFSGMMTAIRAGLTASVSGVPVWGSDIGGYSNANKELTPDVFTRWAQLAAVTPIFEVGGLGTSSHFWDFGQPTTDAFRAASILHYELVPLFLDLSRAAGATGLPITRPLAFTHPADAAAWANDLEFTVGKSLLVAPLRAPGVRASVYLPEGSWVDLNTGQGYTGGQTFTRTTPLTEFPLYLHAASAIPFNLRDPDVWTKPWGLSDLVRSDRAGWLIAPGTGRATSTTAGRIAFVEHGASLTVDVSHAPRDVQLLVLLPDQPHSIAIGGRSYSASTAPALKQRSEGWVVRGQPFGGAVVKLRTNGGAAHVELRF